MNDFTPSPSFEKKMKAATSTPSADPEFVNRLRAQLIALGAARQPSKNQNQTITLTEKVKSFCYSAASFFKGNPTMKTKLFAPALMAVVILVIVGFFILNPSNKVSAQQILDRAASVQSALPTEGVWHSIIEIYENPLALPGDRPGTETIKETFSNLSDRQKSPDPAALSNYLYRTITTNASGKILDVRATDGEFNYSSLSQNSTSTPVNNGLLTIYRTPVVQDSQINFLGIDSDYSAKSLFDEFLRGNPRVEMEAAETWEDGSMALILVNHNEQTQKTASGTVTTTDIGSTRMIFNADTYKLLEWQTSVIEDGQEIVIADYKFTVDEILPATTLVSWDLSDLKNVTFVDEIVEADPNYTPKSKVINEHQLAGFINAYILKTIPEGFSLEIISTPNDPQNQAYNYEINYTNPEGQSFEMIAVGTMEPGFIEKNFYDGSYITSSGLVLNFSPSSEADTTIAMLTIPDGTSFLLTSSMSRIQIQQWVDDLIPAK